MKSATEYLWFNTAQQREYVNITDTVAGIVARSGIQEGFVLVSAMHITAGVYVNDAEDGLIHDIDEWAEDRRPVPSGLPSPPDRRDQRRRPPEEPADRPRGHRADHRRPPRPRPLAADLLRRVRRAAPQARDRQGAGRMMISGRRKPAQDVRSPVRRRSRRPAGQGTPSAFMRRRQVAQGQAHDAGVTAVDGLDRVELGVLDGVGAGLVERIAGRDVSLDLVVAVRDASGPRGGGGGDLDASPVSITETPLWT